MPFFATASVDLLREFLNHLVILLFWSLSVSCARMVCWWLILSTEMWSQHKVLLFTVSCTSRENLGEQLFIYAVKKCVQYAWTLGRRRFLLPVDSTLTSSEKSNIDSKREWRTCNEEKKMCLEMCCNSWVRVQSDIEEGNKWESLLLQPPSSSRSPSWSQGYNCSSECNTSSRRHESVKTRMEFSISQETESRTDQQWFDQRFDQRK